MSESAYMRSNEDKSRHVHVVGVHLQCQKKAPLKIMPFGVNEFSLCQVDLPRSLPPEDWELERVVR